jgi:hypothetical protein
VTRDFHRELTRLVVMFRVSPLGQGAVFSFRVLPALPSCS